jgi:hypothetical protein
MLEEKTSRSWPWFWTIVGVPEAPSGKKAESGFWTRSGGSANAEAALRSRAAAARRTVLARRRRWEPKLLRSYTPFAGRDRTVRV